MKAAGGGSAAFHCGRRRLAGVSPTSPITVSILRSTCSPYGDLTGRVSGPKVPNSAPKVLSRFPARRGGLTGQDHLASCEMPAAAASGGGAVRFSRATFDGRLGRPVTPPAAPRVSILTLDDDPGVSRAVARDLRRRYGAEYRIVRAESGTEALDALREMKLRGDQVAVLLADYRMPQMSG